MGLLKVGNPLTWEETKNHCRYIRRHGVRQFIATWRRVKDLSNDRLFYGDEIEYGLVKLDHERRRAQITLRGPEIMESLRMREQPVVNHNGCTWHQEYGSWMIESTPAGPYGGYTVSLLHVEQNMRLRRARLLGALSADEIAPSVVNFPLMGVGDFVHPQSAPGGPASQSDCVPDAVINPHPRFGTLTSNIRERRGSKVDIRVPLFRDAATPEFEEQDGASSSSQPPQIHMDCMAYGMGCCCLQVTFQASNMEESRYLYDQLATLAPIMLALTAAAPIFKGRLAGTDVRWNTIAASVDDRTAAERGVAEGVPDPRLAGGGVKRLSKSRYDSISTYIHPASFAKTDRCSGYNDITCEVDEELQAELLAEGVDEPIARHIAHLFTRDPLVAFDGAIEEVDDEQSTDHFESIQSTNWQTVRWKPPPPKAQPCAAHIGWRTEFRSMEVQLTDFENAAFTSFIVIVTRALLVFDLCLLHPLSQVDENMRRAHELDAVKTQKFWFRKDIMPDQCTGGHHPAGDDCFEEMTMEEVINGKGCYFPGLVPLCYAYLEHIHCDPTSFQRIRQYLSLIQQRASGGLLTPAAWMRQFVTKHPAYRRDSVVSEEIAYDLLRACDDIGLGRLHCPELLGDTKIEPIVRDGVYATPLASSPMGTEDRRTLLQRYMRRACDCDGPGSSPSSQFMRQRSWSKSSSIDGA